MNTARIAALLEPFLEQPLASSQLDQISTYIDLLLRWNARMNLTAIRDEEEIVTRHFGESLFLARHLFPGSSHPEVPSSCHPERNSAFAEGEAAAKSKLRRLRGVGAPRRNPEPGRGSPDPYSSRASSSLRVLDIGSGAGFPALPLKIWSPAISLTLIESNHKKAAFLSEVTRALTFTNTNIMTDRAETLAPRLASQADVVTLRAVERFQTILPQAAAFLSPHGTLALLITTEQLPKLAILTAMKWTQPIPIPQSHTRVLSIGQLL